MDPEAIALGASVVVPPVHRRQPAASKHLLVVSNLMGIQSASKRRAKAHRDESLEPGSRHLAKSAGEIRRNRSEVKASGRANSSKRRQPGRAKVAHRTSGLRHKAAKITLLLRRPSRLIRALGLELRRSRGVRRRSNAPRHRRQTSKVRLNSRPLKTKRAD